MSYIIFITLLLTPAYALRFNIVGQSANLLLVWVVLVWLFFSIHLLRLNRLKDFWHYLKTLDKKWLLLVFIFFLSGLLALYNQGFSQKKLGQFLVLFLQPISLFFCFGYLFYKNPEFKTSWIYAAYLLLGLMGIWSIIQYFTLFGLPVEYWGNAVEPKRALGFFGHPNFFALFTAPLLAFLIPDLFNRVQNQRNILITPKLFLFWILGSIGLFLSMSRAGWLGLTAAISVSLLLVGNKKLRLTALICGTILTIIILITPNLRYRVILPFMGEKSAVSRLSLWHTGIVAIKKAPIFGLGLTGFGSNWLTLNTDPNLDTHNFPHNVFLDFWVETGLLGLLSFVGLSSLALYQGFKRRNNEMALGVSLFLIALLIQGQIDNPYFKNDLALIFWVILSLAI